MGRRTLDMTAMSSLSMPDEIRPHGQLGYPWDVVVGVKAALPCGGRIDITQCAMMARHAFA